MEQPNQNIGTRKDLVLHRIKNAESDLNAAGILFDAGEYKAANNRAYYAVFHAINAVHALDGNGYKRHKDAIGNFNKHYVKTEIFPREMGKKVSEIEEIRHASDYDDFYLASREETERQIAVASELVQLVETYCMSQIEESVNETTDL